MPTTGIKACIEDKLLNLSPLFLHVKMKRKRPKKAKRVKPKKVKKKLTQSGKKKWMHKNLETKKMPSLLQRVQSSSKLEFMMLTQRAQSLAIQFSKPI